MEVLKRVLAGTLGGFVGGSLIGLGEAAVVSAVSAPSEYWVFVFGSVSYGMIGAGMGFGWGVLTNLLAAFCAEVTTLSTSAAARLNQDVVIAKDAAANAFSIQEVNR